MSVHGTGPVTAVAIMKPPIVVAREAPIRQVAAAMEDAPASAVLVGQAPMWLVTEWDLVGAIAAGLPLDAPVSEVSSRSPVWVSPNTSLDDAARMMTAHKVRHLVVVGAEGEPRGMLDALDVLRGVTA